MRHTYVVQVAAACLVNLWMLAGSADMLPETVTDSLYLKLTASSTGTLVGHFNDWRRITGKPGVLEDFGRFVHGPGADETPCAVPAKCEDELLPPWESASLTTRAFADTMIMFPKYTLIDIHGVPHLLPVALLKAVGNPLDCLTSLRKGSVPLESVFEALSPLPVAFASTEGFRLPRVKVHIYTDFPTGRQCLAAISQADARIRLRVQHQVFLSEECLEKDWAVLVSVTYAGNYRRFAPLTLNWGGSACGIDSVPSD